MIDEYSLFYTINKQYAQNLQQKINVFKAETRKNVLLAMIVANGLKNNLYSQDKVHRVGTLEDLFKPSE